MITRVVAVNNLRKYIGQELHPWALENKINAFVGEKQNKGWKGVTLERLAGLSCNNAQAPNGLGFELKSTAYCMRQGVWKPKETMAITMINYKQLLETPFYSSHCWAKLKSIVFCAVSWEKCNHTASVLLDVQSFDFLEDSTLLKEIEADYEFIRQKAITSGFASLTGKDGKWIQARTKGAGHGSISRAFYAKKSLLNEIFHF